MVKVELCYCELSEDVHVIIEGHACELCDPAGRLPLTPGNVEQAFKFYQKRVAECQKSNDSGVA